MNRRGFLLGVIGAAGGVAFAMPAAAAPAVSLWDDLHDSENSSQEDLPADGAIETRSRRSRGRGYAYGRRRYHRPRGRAYGYYWGPRRRRWRRRRVCRIVRNRYGMLVRRCWRI